MYTKEKINEILERIVKAINISETMFDDAEKAYKDLGDWINDTTPEYAIHVYAQGSFALGTVIKPIDDSDDYDLDLVCEFEKQCGLSAEALKCDVVKPLLERYKKTKDKIENKRRCWHVEYEDMPNFHMDIIPAVNRGSYIDITDHNEDDNTYDYIGSNPRGYIDWFIGKNAERRKIIYERAKFEHLNVIKASANIEKIKEYHIKTPLQKAIQILKRHRDIMFEDDKNQLKPISIIITTIAAELYQNEDNIVDTLTNILENAESYIVGNMIGTEYHIDNPSYTGAETENFANKWNEHPERAAAFFAWIKKAREDLVDDRLLNMFMTDLAENFKASLGVSTTQRVFSEIAKEYRADITNNTKKIDTSTGGISSTGSISIPRNHHYGK